MNRLLEESFLGLSRFDMFGRTMPLDIRETEREFVVEAASPGIKPDELQISVTGDTLTILAEHKAEEEEKDVPEIDETDSGIVKLANQLIIEAYHRGAADIHVEPYLGEMRRTVRLPITVDAENIAATYEHGILTVHLPKAEKTLPKRVPITIKEPAHVS